MEKRSSSLDESAGRPVDISPWAYAWRADRTLQERPEAYFIPRRLNRMDGVYRTAADALPPDKLKSIHYQMPDILERLPAKPEGSLLAGLLWVGRLADYRVELHWPGAAREIPPTDAVEVRVYPTSWGWFGWTVDRVLGAPEVSADRMTWTYRSEPGGTMDWAYNGRVEAATEMVAVFCTERPPVPDIHVIVPGMGVWKRMDVEIEWGFGAGQERSDFDGRIEAFMAMADPIVVLAEDRGTTAAGAASWRSRPSGGSRRGIVVPLLYAPGGPAALRSRITVWMRATSMTFRVDDLEGGPLLIPEHGLFVTKAGSGVTARTFARDLASKNLRSVRQMVREHPEVSSWVELMREVRLRTCPEGTPLPPFPPVEDPPMEVRLSDAGWTAAWRAASFQLKGRHMWGGLAVEVGRVAHDMDLVGHHEEADKVYQYFLAAPGAKHDGDYGDASGALEWAKAMRHDMGYSHDGTHASTGLLLYAMADRFFLGGDKEWLGRNRERLQAAADWIIRQRRLYMKDIPNRERLAVAGLMPPCMLGDYALPASDWHWYFADNAMALQGLQRFADALGAIDPAAGTRYQEEAEAFRRDIRRAVDREAALSPVRRCSDGVCRSFIPMTAYSRGLTGPELDAPQFPDSDLVMGSLAEPFSALDPEDSRIADTLEIMEEMRLSAGRPGAVTWPWHRMDKKSADYLGAGPGRWGGSWFWSDLAVLPKGSHNANIYLLQDDVPSFLRFWMSSYAAMVGSDGRLWEVWRLGEYGPCKAQDHGEAGWFLECFRLLLVMEQGRSLWLARATPRAWLEQGKSIVVKNAPTYFGTLGFEIESDVSHGRITATIEIPDRDPPKSVFVRFRHPEAKPIRGATVDGRPWTRFHPDKEAIELAEQTGTVTVVARY